MKIFSLSHNLSVLFLAGCVLLPPGCATSYQKDGMTGGYTDKQLNEDTFYVSFRGNGWTKPDKVDAYFLRRCAEVAKEHGYELFTIHDSSVANTGGMIQTSEGSFKASSTTKSVGLAGYETKTEGSYSAPEYTQVNKYTRSGTVIGYPKDKAPKGALSVESVLSSTAD